MSCDLPGDIDTLDSFWQALIGTSDQISTVPDKRWSMTKFVSDVPQTPGKMLSGQGGF